MEEGNFQSLEKSNLEYLLSNLSPIPKSKIQVQSLKS